MAVPALAAELNMSFDKSSMDPAGHEEIRLNTGEADWDLGIYSDLSESMINTLAATITILWPVTFDMDRRGLRIELIETATSSLKGGRFLNFS